MPFYCQVLQECDKRKKSKDKKGKRHERHKDFENESRTVCLKCK